MSIETFDWQGYMSDIGYAPEQIPNEINDEDREWLYGLWARDLMEQINYEVKQNPFFSTAKEKASEARRQFLEYAPDLAHFFGEEVQPNNPNATFDPEEFRQHVVNNEVQNANLGYYLDTFAASRINEDTDVKWPWLKGLTKDQFKKSFMEQQDIDEAWTSVDDIRNGNFGTLAANYQAQLAQQQGLRGDEKSGHIAALKQGWYEFEKLFGYTAGTLGDATGIQWLSDIGNEIAQNVIQKSDAYNYQSKYNQSLADTIKNEGVMAAGGKILNMAEENWATTAAPLALAAIGKILSTYAHVPQPLADAATRAVAANVVRRQGANLLRRASQLAYGSSAALSGLEIGGVRAELEEHGKYDPNNVADVVAAGLVSSSLDFIGNVAAMKGISITAGRLWRSNLATMEARSRLAKEIAEDQAKSFTHRVLSAMAVEGVTEGLQEIPAMVVGARRGIEYTSKEVRDRIIDAAAVGAFMGGGIRTGEIMLEKYHRGDEESPTDTDADETPETPDVPETPPQPSQPPPPDFDGEMPFNNVTYRPTENGFVAADPFNVGYGATRNEAAEDFLKNANKGRVDIDANDIRSVPPSATEEGSSIVRYGNNGEHSVRIIGQGSNALIRKIIDIHNNPKNAVNLQGHNTFNVSDFQSTNPDLNEDQFIRSVLEQKKTGRGSSNDVILNRTNAVDIPVNLTAVPRTDIAGSYAAFNLDQDSRDALRGKGFTILSNPKSRENGRIQKLLLYRNGFVYTVTLRNSATDDNVSAVVEAEHIKDINARRQITNKDQNKKARNENIKRNSLEAGVRNQTLRVVTTDPVTDVRSTSERKSSITIAPVLRAGFVELNRRVNAEGIEEFTIDPRKILEKRIKDANGKIEKVGARGITYTSGGETTRLDITADGRVVVSTDGRFVGDYEFFDPADLTEGERRASFQSTRIEATQPFNVIDIPEELQFDGRVTFVYEGDENTPENRRNYYAIRNNGDVYYISPAEDNYIKRLLRLQYIQNLNDARDVFGNQFIEFYALPEFYEDGEVRQFVGFKTENNLLPVVNLEDPTLQRFSDREVDDLISAGYNREFVKVYAIIAPNGEVVRATTEEGVDAFISDIKGYANILDDSEWNPSSRGESIFGDAYIERGFYREEDLYGAGYEASPSDDNVTDDDISKDNEKIREATKKIVDQIGEEIKALRDQHKRGKYHLSNSRISEYESVLSDLERDITFSESSTFNYYPGTVREINENLRRRFYAMRTAQAMLHIDLYRNKLGSYTSVLNREELDRVLANTSLTFDENATIEELRRNTIQVESIAVRLEEAYIKTFPLNDSTKLTTLLWQTIYSDPVEGNYGSFVNRIHSEGTDFRFSRAAETPRVRRKDSILNELQKELGDFTLDTMLEKGLRGESGGLVILPDQEAAHNIERMFTTDATQPYYDDEGLIQGFVAPDGMIYLVEDGIVDGKARQIILHEYGVHARKFGMTDAQFQEVVQNIKAKRDEKSAEGDFVRKCITRAKQANKNMSEDNPIFWEEVAAYAVEDGYHLADTGIVGRMQTWMKNWLWRFGVIDATAFHYQDFVNMAQGMLGNPGPLSFFDGTHDYTKYQDSWKNIPKFSHSILAEDTPDREEFAQRTYRRLRGLDDAIDRERNGEDAESIEQATDWRRNDNGDWNFRYSFAGEIGAAALDAYEEVSTRMDNLAIARQMEEAGKDAKAIKYATNWERGADNKWRYEIDNYSFTLRSIFKKLYGFEYSRYMRLRNDISRINNEISILENSSLVINPNNQRALKIRDEYISEKRKIDSELSELDAKLKKIDFSLSDFLDDSDYLLHAYPILKNYTFSFANDLDGVTRGSTDLENKKININIGLLVDEIFNPEKSNYGVLLHEIQHVIQNEEGFAQGANLSLTEEYRNLAGEVEARNVARRINLSVEERRSTLASETEDVSREDQIIIYNALEALNIPSRISTRATAEELKPYSSFINTLENDLVSQRISGVPNEGDTVLYQRGDVNEFITRDSLYTIEDANDYYPDIEQRWIDYHRDDSESNFVRYSRSIPEGNEELEREAQRQYQEIYDKYHGTDQWLKVFDRSTGEYVDSNLNERQWVQVRTPLFKQWFGDWENDPENASIIVDKYGEPLPVYHGTSEVFEEFDTSGAAHTGEKATFFTSNPQVASSYVEGPFVLNENEEVVRTYIPGGNIIPVFLNVRNPEIWEMYKGSYEHDFVSSALKEARKNKNDGVLFKNMRDPAVFTLGSGEVSHIIAVFKSTQIKSSIGNVGTFDPKNGKFRYSRSVPTGMQNQADVIYPDASAEIQAIRYSRQSAEDILRRERPGFTPEQVKVVLDELDSYGDDEKKQKLVLHWVVKGQLDLPQDKYKIDPAIKYASSNLGVDPYSLSPQEIINRYQKANPSGTPIRPGRKTSEDDDTKYIEDEFPGIFTDFKDHGDGIVSYEVEDSRKGQEAMRKIMNTHWGRNQSPWCLLYANNQGELRNDAWKWWSIYNKLPKRVAFKKGDLISFMATEDDPASSMSIEFAINRLRRIMIDFPHRYVNLSSFAEDYARYDDLRRLLINFEVMTDANSSVPEYLTINRENIFFLREELSENVIKFLSQSLREKFESLFEGELLRLDLTSYESDIFRSALMRRQNEVKRLTENAKKEWIKWVEKEGVNIYDEEIINAKLLEKPNGSFYTFHDLNGDGNDQIIIFYKQEDGSYIYGASEITEKWWDRDNESHPDLDWARDYSVHGLRYSRAATIDEVPQTARQRGTQVPNAPGMYKMPDGSLHIEPSELPVGFESETILYAAIAISDPAKEEPKIAELRGLILTDPDLMRETDRMMRERNDTNEDHRLGYAVSLILEAYDPTSNIYQQTVDAFHEAVSKATGGAYQNLVLDTGQIEAAAHAAAGIPYEALLTAPQETVPTPRPDTADVQRQQLEEAFANSDAQREYMQVGEDGRAFIATDDSDVDVVFESKVTNPFDTGEIADKVLVDTTEHNESEDFYNHLADSPTDRTQEPLDTGRFTAQADTMRNEVEAFLASVLPEHIWNRMQILWEDNADNRKLLDNALGKFTPKAWQNKNILIRGWDRSFGQVVRTAAREASRFGWGLWQNRDFRKALTDFYDMYTARIHEELRPYYNQMGVTDPTKLTNGQKIFMVQTFFSKLNQSLFTDDATNMADILGIDAQEYKRVLANVKRGISAQENDLSHFMSGVAGNPELAKQFASEMLRMTMETATNVGTHFVYERANTLGGKDRIRVYTNEWGTWRNTEPKTRFGKVAKQIKENLEWWHWRYKGNPRAEKFARWMMRNAPVWMKYPFKWMHLYVPSARLGDTTLGKASQMISRVWQRIGDMSGTTIQQDYALMEDIHGILRDYGYDPLVANDMFDQTGRRITYEQFFRSLGITSAKAMEKARLADEVVRTAEGLRKEQAANIRSMIVETGVSLYNRMVNAGVPQRNIEAMVNDFERKRQKFHDNYAHRMYEAFTPEGKSELARMLHYLKRDPVTGEESIAKRARRAQEQIRQAEARYGRGTSQFYKETAEARADLRRYERLAHLWNFEMAVLRDKKRLFGAELNEAVVTAMKNTINAIILDAQSIGRIDAQAVPHYNSISAQKARKLNPENDVHRELMAFLSEIKDPMRVAVYSADQQRQIIAKLQFNKELGEYLVDNGMATIRGVPSAEGIARDLAQMESGTFLEYINVDPAFMPEIKAEYENMQKVTETVLGGLTDAVKANSTVYSLRLAMNNYIGNASMLLASGHFWRFGNWMEAGGIVRKQFLDRFTYGAKDPSDFGKMIIKEMEDAMVTGGSGTEMSVFQLNKGAHENFVQMMTGLLYSGNLLSRAGKFKADNFVKRALEYARKFYTYGDEWVKPLMYINNRMNAIAKYEAIEKRRNGETEEEYQERVLKKAIEEASEMTIRETVSWENSPFFVRQLSTKSARFFVPDFLLHNFQMLRITASNYVRLMELGRELRNFNPTEMNPDKVDAYRSALTKEFVQRGVGGAMTAGVYAGLAGATGSCMAFIPYMMNTVFAAIDGEDDKDKDKTFFNPQEWEGAQRILNYKTGGDNFFVPAWKHNGKIYAWNYGRASVMLTHAIPQPATENPEFADYAAQFFKNIVNIGGGTIAQEIVNNAQGKDKWGREIGMEAGWGRIFDRVIVPGAVRQLLDMSVGYPGSSDNPYREGKAIKMSDAVGITVNAYDMRDIVNEVGWNMGRVGSNSQNVARKSFVKRLTESDALSDSQIASLVSDMRESNAMDFDKANYVLTGLRQMGMENKEIAHWLTVSRKDANIILSKKQANAFLKGQNIYDENLVTYLKNRRNNLAKGQDDVRMSKEELAVVLQNYDKAIRIYSQALRTN